jgi:hypothetical protein
VKCKNCGHDHKHSPKCPVIIRDHAELITANDICPCREFVEPADEPVCPGCGEVVSYSHSISPLHPPLPYLFVCVWCTGCKHILAAQVTVMLAPMPQGAPGAKSNLRVPGGPL